MAEGATPQSHPTSEELHWGVSYLREDIQDLRNQVGSVHHRIDEFNRSLSGRIDEFNRSLGERIDETNRRIDETNRSLREQIQAVHKRMDAHFMWIMTTLVAITGILIGVIKL